MIRKHLPIITGNEGKFVYDELHGFIRLSDVYLKIVDTPTFQRLRRIKQLAQAWYVYPGAVHTRFSHSLGVFRLAEVISDKFTAMGYIDSDEARLLRVAALLHDIGHAPYSHTLEQYFLSRYGLRHEDVTVWVIEEDPNIKDVLRENGIEPSEVTAIIRGIHKNRVLNKILSSDLDVDRLDYLPRDALHTGVAYGLIDLDRIIQTLTVSSEGDIAVPYKAIQAIESFYIARLHMYRAVYYHKTITSYQLLLGVIHKLMVETPEVASYLEPFISPQGILKAIREGAFHLWDDSYIGGVLNMIINKELGNSELRRLIESYLRRNSYRVVYERIVFSDRPLASKLRELVSEINYILESKGFSDYRVRTFIESINIVSEDSGVKVVDVAGNPIPISKYEGSIIGKLPKYMNILRIYALPSVEPKIKALLSNVLNHDIGI